MPKSKTDLVHGTLDMLVLRVVAHEPMHGWGICERIQEISRDVLRINHGSLYPALQRLSARGWLRPQWRTTDNNRRARYYELTAQGRRQLQKEVRAWERSSEAVNRILGNAWQEG